MKKRELCNFYLPLEFRSCENYHPRGSKVWCYINNDRSLFLRLDIRTSMIDARIEFDRLDNTILPIDEEQLILIPSTGLTRECKIVGLDGTETPSNIDIKELYSDGYREHIPIKFIVSDETLIAGRITRKSLSLLNLRTREVDIFQTLYNMPDIQNVVLFSYAFSTSWNSREDGIFVSLTTHSSTYVWDVLSRTMIRLSIIPGNLGTVRLMTPQRSMSPKEDGIRLTDERTSCLPVMGTTVIYSQSQFYPLLTLKPTDVPGIFVEELVCDVEDTRVELSEIYFKKPSSRTSAEVIEEKVKELGQCKNITRGTIVITIITSLIVMFYYVIKGS